MLPLSLEDEASTSFCPYQTLEVEKFANGLPTDFGSKVKIAKGYQGGHLVSKERGDPD